MQKTSDLSHYYLLLEQYFSDVKSSLSGLSKLTSIFKTKPNPITTLELAKITHQLVLKTDDRDHMATQIIISLHAYRSNIQCEGRMAALKEAIQQLFNNDSKALLNWKDCLYGANFTKVLAARWTEIKVNHHIDAPFTLDNSHQHHCQTSSHLAAAIMSTTFFTNSKTKLERNNQLNEPAISHVMDSCFCAHQTNLGNITHFFLAIADGLGGHTGDLAEDRRISRASYFACKHAIRLLSTYSEPEILKENIFNIIRQIDSEIKLKNNHTKDSTTLTCAVAFKQKNTIRVIGFNIGDSMLVAWHPPSNNVKTLLPGRHLVQIMGQGPAYLPANYNIKTDIDIIDETLPENTILIPFTDGFIEAFNVIKLEDIREDKNYIIISIDPDDILPTLSKLSPQSSADECVNALMAEVMRRTENKRQLIRTQAKETSLQLSKFQEDARIPTAIALEKQRLNKKYAKAYQKRLDNVIDEEVYLQKRGKFDGIKLELRNRENDYRNQLEAFQSKIEVQHGDDIAVMAVKF